MNLGDFLRRAWSLWLQAGRWLGNLVGRVELTVLYFTLLAPFGLGVALFSDPLQLKPAARGSTWLDREPVLATFEAAERQF